MDVDGPMSWPRWWKVVILLNVSFYSFMGNFYAAGVTPLFQYIVVDLNCTVEEASWLASYTVLTLGLSNLATDFITYHIGIRQAILSTMALFTGAIIWSAAAQSYGSLMASRLVGGLAGGIIEALGPLIVTQIFPVEELGRALVVYMAFLAAGSTIGPVITGFIASGTGSWRWCFGIMAIATGVNLISTVLMLPETSSMRPPQDTTHAETIDDDKVTQKTIEHAESSDISTAHRQREIWLCRSFFWRYHSPRPNQTWYKLFLEPFKMLLVPPVLLCVLMYGWTVGCSTVSSIVFSAAYAAPPHLWDAQQIGLISLAALVALIIGSPIGGNLADYLTMRASRRNGVHTPEGRLVLVGLSFLVAPTGLILIGLAISKNLSWVAIALGLGMLAFAVSTASSILLNYCVDCFAEHSGQIGVLVNVMKNVLGTILSFFAVDWYLERGTFKIPPASQKFQDWPQFSGFMKPCRFEGDIQNLEVIGTIPKEIHGTFYRVMPDPALPPYIDNDPWFNGDGSVSAFYINDGVCDYKQRYVQTEKFQKERSARKALMGKYRNKYTDAIEFQIRTTSNTNVVYHNGKLLACKEDGLPYAMDPLTLETIGYWDFEGQVQSMTFTAHPKFDPTTKEMVCFGYEARGDGTPDICYYVADAKGKITETVWLWFRSPNAFPGHLSNAYENEQGSIIVDLPMCDKNAFFWWPDKHGRAPKPEEITTHMKRFIIDPKSNDMELPVPELLLAKQGEFPRIDDRVAMRDYSHVFLNVFDPTLPMNIPAIAPVMGGGGPLFNAIGHFNVKTREYSHFFPGPTSLVQEPIFFPRSSQAPEGDGYVMVLVNQYETMASDLAIIDTVDMSNPVAIVKLPVRLRPGLHGNWVDASDMDK
ncbi:hypothetical protein FE257_007149 [Aspergillus nanangensis]|uniref:Major facilitator superfamily (MFS) profile domain-containing protein n=1 Tax=Aspergillus nanangensis TaxID=2582783 RepID=A0AAD4CNA7_ASPNN|nr:hypothetical protein FE257_007149 [Aspergillus nanangensis]